MNISLYLQKNKKNKIKIVHLQVYKDCEGTEHVLYRAYL